MPVAKLQLLLFLVLTSKKYLRRFIVANVHFFSGVASDKIKVVLCKNVSPPLHIFLSMMKQKKKRTKEKTDKRLFLFKA